MTRAEAITYLRKLAAVERQQIVDRTVKTTPYIAALELAITELGEVERLRGRLRELEWSCEYRRESACPVCKAYDDGRGHTSTCWLAAELR
jgi:hypothetical protein